MGREGEIDFTIPESPLEVFPGERPTEPPDTEQRLLATLEKEPGNTEAQEALARLRSARRKAKAQGE